MKALSKLLILMLFAGGGKGQEIPGQYVEAALSNNLVLKERSVSVEKSLLALKEARSLFLPTSTFEGQYTLANGGRSIDIPVGDLLNPVYKTLNQLTSSHNFPTVSNSSEQLNPNNFYDLRIRTSVPLVEPSLKYNRNISKLQVELSETDLQLYKRELIRDVKLAYYRYMMADKAVDVFRSALEVVNENLRVNRSLLSNGKTLPAYVSRAETEVQQVESQLTTAEKERQNASSYFNFLLNQPLEEPIEKLEPGIEEVMNSFLVQQEDIRKREELKSLSIAKNINEQTIRMNQSYRVPRLNAFLDLASQGFDFSVNSESFYYLGGVQVKLPLFAGKRNIYKIEQSKLDAKVLEIRQDQLQEQLQLGVSVSRNNVVSAYSNYQAAVKQRESAQKYFKLIDRGYREGSNSFIEFLDARNQVTHASLQLNIKLYQVLGALAEHERQAASFSFN